MPGKYAATFVRAVQNKYNSLEGEGPFVVTQKDLREAAAEMEHDFRNFPDLAYYLRSRAKKLPKFLRDAGFQTLEITGKGEYTLLKVSSAIKLPARANKRVIGTDLVPAVIRNFLRQDEQSILSVVAYTKLLDDFLGYPCHHLQSHLRTTTTQGLQVEADDVFIGDVPKGQKTVIPIEAKGPNERLSYTQMKPTIAAVMQRIPKLVVIPVGLKLANSGFLEVLEFSFEESGGRITHIELSKYAQYELRPPLPFWPKPS